MRWLLASAFSRMNVGVRRKRKRKKRNAVEMEVSSDAYPRI
jgi:hypothetical protein